MQDVIGLVIAIVSPISALVAAVIFTLKSIEISSLAWLLYSLTMRHHLANSHGKIRKVQSKTDSQN